MPDTSQALNSKITTGIDKDYLTEDSRATIWHGKEAMGVKQRRRRHDNPNGNLMQGLFGMSDHSSEQALSNRTTGAGTAWTAGAVFLLVAVTVLVFGKVCSHEFTWWDDPMTLHHNPRYNPPSGEKIAETWKEPVDGLYAPVTYSYWGAMAYLAERKGTDRVGIHLDARVFHAGSLILHLASVLVIFSILRLLSGHLGASLAGAMLFAVHPLQVETVAWASGAKDVLCGLLSLCAIYQYILFTRAENKSRARVYYIGGAVVLLLAMLAKPSAMVVPVIVAALDGLVLKRNWRKAARTAGGWLVLIAPLAVIARFAQTTTDVAHVAIWQRPLIAADAIAFYFGKLVWPVGLTPDYGRRPGLVLQMWGGAWPYLIWLVPAAVAVLAWRSRARRPSLLAGLVIFVAGFGPVLGLTPFMFQYTSSVADHYVYLPMFGVALGATGFLTRLATVPLEAVRIPEGFPRYRGRVLAGVCSIMLVMLGVRSFVQLGYWQNDQTIWAHTMEVSPGSFNAPTNLAAALGRQGYVMGRDGEDEQEKGHAKEAAALFAERRRCYEGAVALLEKAIVIKPDYITARHNAFLNYLRLGETQKAVDHLEAMLAANEKLPAGARSNFTTYHDAAGNLWMKLGQYDKAAAHFETVLAKVPDHVEAKKELEKAREWMAEARVE